MVFDLSAWLEERLRDLRKNHENLKSTTHLQTDLDDLKASLDMIRKHNIKESDKAAKKANRFTSKLPKFN